MMKKLEKGKNMIFNWLNYYYFEMNENNNKMIL